MTWNYIVIVCCLALLVFLTWKEYSRQNRSRLVWRLLASVLAVSALACMAIPIMIPQTVTNTGNEAVLLTDGFDKDSLSAFKDIQLYTADEQVSRGHPSLKIKYTPGLDLFISEHPDLSKLHIVGYGLGDDALNLLKNIPVQFHPSALPAGISYLHWQKTIRLGEQMQLQGKFNNTAPGKLKLVLSGLGSKLDSVFISPGSQQQIELKTAPKHIGRTVYQLIALSGKDTVENEEIPVEIMPQEPFKILLLASAPDFENKFLKSWLYRQGYQVASRTTISKGKFNTEFLNTASIPLNNINRSMLQKFDLAVADMAELHALSPAETASLKDEVSGGLGLLMIADSTSKASYFSRLFQTYGSAQVAEKSLTLKMPGNSLATITAEQPVYIHPKAGSQALIRNTKGNITVSMQLLGAGKIALSTLSNTYTWALSGDTNSYASFWSPILEKAARRKPEAGRIAITGQFPVVNERNEVIAEGLNQPIFLSPGQSKIAPLQNPQVPFQFTGTFWPAGKGWVSISHAAGQRSWQYIYNPGSWKTVKANLKIAATQNFVKSQVTAARIQQTDPGSRHMPLSKTWFFFLFLISCGYLWYEAKKS